MVQIYVFIDFNCLFCLLLFALSVLCFKQHKVSNLFFFPFGIIVFLMYLLVLLCNLLFFWAMILYISFFLIGCVCVAMFFCC